jgi:hypothetical protein
MSGSPSHSVPPASFTGDRANLAMGHSSQPYDAPPQPSDTPSPQPSPENFDHYVQWDGDFSGFFDDELDFGG